MKYHKKLLRMLFIFVSVFSLYLLAGCHSNESSKNIEQVKDTLKHKVYITEKADCAFSDKEPSDSIFRIDSDKVTVFISYECKGDYAVLDTDICDSDTCHILLFRNQYVHIKIKSSSEKEILISKELLLKNMHNIQNYLLDVTCIDSIAKGQKQIIFKSYLRLPGTTEGGGFNAIYSIPIEGEEKSVKFIRVDKIVGDGV